jgi:asparagine synthase (glutamine-hydrolysing)
MCGIAGFFEIESKSKGSETLKRMTDVVRHRGPDDEGHYVQESAGVGVCLGHRRLSIVDLALGHQPLGNETNDAWIVFNGEIYNHGSLRPELEQLGHRYRTQSDTETILHGWEQWGAGSLERLRGMFSFVIWDSQRRRLSGARDRYGIKPLYYYWNGKVFAFASEIKALFCYPGIDRELNEALLPEYLSFGYAGGDQTMFRHVRKLMPGHWFELSCNGGRWDLRVERYWDVPETGVGGGTEAEWMRRLEQGLEEATELHLMADVPLGTFLSGGVDSSLITALVQRMAGGELKTFSVGYRETAFSELGFAAEVAQALKTAHREVVIGREEFFGTLARLIWHEDEPISWPSSVSLYHVSRLAGTEVKVVLTGEGADELFGGYERYRWNLMNRRMAAIYGIVPELVRGEIRRWIENSTLLSGNLRRKLGHTVLGRDPGIESLFLDNFYGAFGRAEQQRLFGRPVEGIYDAYLSYWTRRRGGELDRMLYADQKTYLVELLMKQDQMSMGASIESRVPFLDHEFAALAMQIPDGLKIRGREQKYILKRVAEKHLPAGIVYRKKMGFPTPLRQWLRDEETAELLERLLSKGNYIGAYLDLDVVKGLIARHQSGAEDATDRLWRLLNLELWGQLQFNGMQVEG